MREFLSNAVVITDGDIIFYYTGFYVDDGFLVICNGKRYLITDGRYIEYARLIADAECYLINEVSLDGLLERLQVNSVGLIYGYTSAALYERLVTGGYNVYDYTGEYNRISAVKTVKQLQTIKTACSVCEKAFLKTLDCVKEGITELELAGELEYNFKKLGAGVGFETIVAFGKGSSVPHYKTGTVKLSNNVPVLMDFGCRVDGFLSDMTRTFFFGTPTDEFVRAYDSVKNAHLTAVNNVTAGITCKQADKIARDCLIKDGLGECFTHSTGHGIGVKIHEYPTLNTKSQTVLENGMVFSIEPGVYLEGKFGIRIEDTFTIENGKCVSLMTTDKNLLVL